MNNQLPIPMSEQVALTHMPLNKKSFNKEYKSLDSYSRKGFMPISGKSTMNTNIDTITKFTNYSKYAFNAYLTDDYDD